MLSCVRTDDFLSTPTPLLLVFERPHTELQPPVPLGNKLSKVSNQLET